MPSVDTEICDLHELLNCAICNGDLKRQEQSLMIPPTIDGRPPAIAGGTTIFAKFPGTCEGCGRRYDRNDPIHRPYDEESEGWLGVDCCVKPA